MFSSYLTNTSSAVEEKKMTGHFYNKKEFWTGKK